MKINYDKINASVEKLKAAVAAQSGAGAEDQAKVDAIADAVSAEADKLNASDGGPSTGGITA